MGDAMAGFWIVQYEGMAGNGGGVAMFIKGHVFGGDTGYTYLGSYDARNDLVRASINVQNYLPGVPSVVGITGDFQLEIEGRVAEAIFNGAGRVVGQQAVGVALKLTRVAELPE